MTTAPYIDMSLSNVEFFIKETAVNVRRHGLMTLAAISTITVALCVLGALGLALINLNALAEQVAGRMELEVFFDRELDAEAVTDLVAQVEQTPNVREVRFVPRTEALRRLKESLEGNLDLSDLEENNPLEDSAEVSVVDPEALESTAKSLGALKGVTQVLFGRKLAERILRLRRLLRLSGMVAAALMVLASLMIVHNTIRLTVFARRREIRIMQLVGATDRFIRVPFLLEGLFHGLAGGAVTCGLLLPAYARLVETLAVSMPFVPLVGDASLYAPFAGGLVGAGAVFGFSGSLWSVRRFLGAEGG